jgi:radical SAM-linked protein
VENGLKIEEMPMARLLFSKRGRARYISHLDVMRMFTRAFRRSGLPLWHTQGFNPHVYMMFPLPLALGCESVCEALDIRLTQKIPLEEVTERLNAALPPGFEVLRAAAPVMEPGEIALADYALSAKELGPKLAAFLEQGEIIVQKKTKKGEKPVDIKPHCELISAEDPVLRLAAGITLNINPSLLLSAFYDKGNHVFEGLKITRTRIMTAENKNFE